MGLESAVGEFKIQWLGQLVADVLFGAVRINYISFICRGFFQNRILLYPGRIRPAQAQTVLRQVKATERRLPQHIWQCGENM
jgi:hypothetical protein